MSQCHYHAASIPGRDDTCEFLIRMDVMLSWPPLPWPLPALHTVVSLLTATDGHKVLESPSETCSDYNHKSLALHTPGCVGLCVCMWCYYSHVIWRMESIRHSLEGWTRLKANIFANLHLATCVQIAVLMGEVLAKELHIERHKAGVNHTKLKL